MVGRWQQLCWLPEDKAKKKAQQKQEKRDAWVTAAKEKQAAKRPKLDAPTVPTMAFEDAQLDRVIHALGYHRAPGIAAVIFRARSERARSSWSD